MNLNDTMKAQPFVVTPADYYPALNVLGIKVTVLASNAATQSYEITLQQGDEGTGPPLPPVIGLFCNPQLATSLDHRKPFAQFDFDGS
jgi:hypothetical protein